MAKTLTGLPFMTIKDHKIGRPIKAFLTKIDQFSNKLKKDLFRSIMTKK